MQSIDYHVFFVYRDCSLLRLTTGVVSSVGPNILLLGPVFGGVDNPIGANITTWKVSFPLTLFHQ